MLNTSFIKALSLYLVFAMVLISFPAQGWAMFLPAGPGNSVQQTDRATVQKALESAVIRQRLMDLGLSPQEAMARINRLSNGQIHDFALRLNSLQAGGDGVDALIFLLLVAILVVVALEVTGHRVIVR